MIQRSSVDGVPDLPEQQRSGQPPARWHVCLWLLRVFLRCREVLCNNHTSDSRFCNASLSSSQQIFDWVKSSDKNHEIPLSLSVYPCFTHDTTWIFTQIEKSRPPNRGCFQASWTEIHGGATLTGGFFTPVFSGYLEDVVFIWMCVFFCVFIPISQGNFPWPKTLKIRSQSLVRRHGDEMHPFPFFCIEWKCCTSQAKITMVI